MESTLSKQRTERFGKADSNIIDILCQRGNPRSNPEAAELVVVSKPSLLRCMTEAMLRGLGHSLCVGTASLRDCQKTH